VTARANTVHASRLAQKAVYALLAVAILRFWIMPLGSSLWLDETGTFWTIKDGLRFIVARSQEWPSATPAYGLICWAAYAVGGAHEYAIRLPSVLGIAIASLLMYRLARRLLGKDSALPAVAVFICSQTVVFAAADARPYALILALVMGSTLALVNWLDTGRRRYAAIYVVTVALIPELHYLTVTILGVHAMYAIARLREGTPVKWPQLAFAAAAVGILVAPLAPVVLQLARQSGTYSWAGHPLLPDLAETLAPPVLVFAAAFGLLLAWLVCGKLEVLRAPVDLSAICLVLVLTCGPVFFNFAVSALSRTTSIFVGRYMIASTAGLAMLAGWGIGRIRPPTARSIITGSIIACSVVSFGNMGRLWPLHGREDWRGAMQAVRKVAGTTHIPVLVQSGFVESSNHCGDIPDYLMAPLDVYPPGGHVIPLSGSFDERSRSCLETSVLPTIEHESRFVLVTYGEGNPYDIWMADRLPGYSSSRMGQFGKINATLFERSLPVK
jgi:hypothetical protein